MSGTTTDDDATTTGDACDWGGTLHFVALVAIVDGEAQSSVLIEEETTLPIPVVSDLQGGIVFGTYGEEVQLVRHGADGLRLGALGLPSGPQDLTRDGTGRIIYAGRFDEGMAYGVLDQALDPVGPRRVLPWGAPLLQHQLKIAGLPDGSIVVAGGGQRGSGRLVSRLDPSGDEVWTTSWPVGSQPDDHGNAQVAGIAVLADGTSAIALTSGDLYEGDLSLEAFAADGQHAWAATIEDVRAQGLTVNADTFVVSGRASSSDGNAYGYASDGTRIWSTPLASSGGGGVHPCAETDFIAASGAGFTRISSDGTSTEHSLDLMELVQSQLSPDQPYDGLEIHQHDAVCTSEGAVILVADVTVYTETAVLCDSDR